MNGLSAGSLSYAQFSYAVFGFIILPQGLTAEPCIYIDEHQFKAGRPRHSGKACQFFQLLPAFMTNFLCAPQLHMDSLIHLANKKDSNELYLSLRCHPVCFAPARGARLGWFCTTWMTTHLVIYLAAA